MFLAILTASLLSAIALGCAEHNYQTTTKRAAPGAQDWAYEASYDWGRLSPDYVLCQDGTMQAPIPLRLDQGLSLNHIIHFDNYNFDQAGTFGNWGYGPSMTFEHPDGDFTSLPSLSYEDGGQNQTVYMIGWHIHAPADHTVQGVRSKAELHYVHVDAQGVPRAVLAMRIDPGSAPSPFFSALPELISFRELDKTVQASTNPSQAVHEVDDFAEFWTYKGSLTSPPCTEGIRFFMARQILFTNVEQMRELLRNSHFSARAEQQVWRHQINV